MVRVLILIVLVAALVAYVMVEKRINHRPCPACGFRVSIDGGEEICPVCGSVIRQVGKTETT